MNIDGTILNKILANRTQQYTKKHVYHDQDRFTPEMQRFCTTSTLINVIQYINKLKDEKHMISSIDEEKYFDKVQHPVMIETLQTMGIE